METKIAELPKSEIKLTVKLTDKEWKELYEGAIRALGSKVKVPGFREGKAPFEMVEKTVGREKAIGYAIETNLSKLYAEAVKKEGITPLSRPVVDIISDEPLEFTAEVAVKPKIEIKGLDKIKIKAPKIKVDEKEVEKAIEHLRKVHAEYDEKDTKAKKGDKVEIDFEGKDEQGALIEGAKSENHPVVIGEGNFIPGFEENLDGLKKGESKEFTVTFPEDYHAKELQKKPVTFNITVKGVFERKLPEINEEFTEKAVQQKLNKEEFEKFVKHELEHEAMDRKKTEQEDELFDTLLKKSDFEVSDQLVEEELKLLVDEMAQNITRQGLNPEQYFAMIEKKEGKPKEEIFKEKAVDRVKVKFIIEYIINTLEIKASDEDINAKAQEMISRAPDYLQKNIEAYYKKDSPGFEALRQQVILDMIFTQFLEPIEHSC